MFLPPKLITILLGQLIALTMLSASVNGQQADFERRLAAMQAARARAQAPAPANSATRIASSDIGVDFTDPPPPPGREVRVASRTSSPKPINKSKRVSSRPDQPQRIARQSQAQSPKRIPTRVAQGSGSTIIPDHLGAPMSSYPTSQPIVDGGYILSLIHI